ncbi:MAG TPA: bifunctional diaminohydroxyphosphoribosylaminopyrimidine deaminase/5-amino-6-(5-phosphoribosylamino)uracil reductase RibD, partial [Myxococcota bacterium]
MRASAFSHLIEPLPPSALAHVDAQHLAQALEQAVRGVGRTSPNPAVGAVLVQGGAVVGRGFHARAGERHGEIVALDDARAHGAVTRAATLYVTLEPCVHHGRTPPCVDRILADGIAHVVVGALDPNPRVHSAGVAALRAAGV